MGPLLTRVSVWDQNNTTNPQPATTNDGAALLVPRGSPTACATLWRARLLLEYPDTARSQSQVGMDLAALIARLGGAWAPGYGPQEQQLGDDEDNQDERHASLASSQFLLQMLQAEGSQDGPASPDEKQKLASRGTARPTTLVAQHLALQAAQAVRVLKGVAPSLPPEVCLGIADLAASSPPFEGCCRCHDLSAGRLPGSPNWKVLSPGEPGTCLLCADCGRVRAVTAQPLLPLNGAIWPLSASTVSSPHPARWKNCRHFHRERRNDRGDSGELSAVRHRASGLHSFRTIVANEWILSGSRSYELYFEQLEPPFAAGIGVGTQPTRDSNPPPEMPWHV